MTRRGGHLGVHADFNLLGKVRLERRINLLVYSNDDLLDEYGGKLELWDKAMIRAEQQVTPQLGRAVVFNTTLDSYHGYPDPLTCPPERDRRSIATCYYTAFPAERAGVPDRTTNFKPRPGSQDAIDWTIRSHHFIREWIPLKLQPIAQKLNPFR